MSEALAPGFFGKVPARGDFLARRVPPSIAAPWETWLQAMTAGVRESGAQGWQDAWLTAPLWHFVLGRNVAGPFGAAGVLVASADRVGRLFPFTLIAAATATADDGRSWAQEAETLALAALDDGFDPAELDLSLARLGPPPAPQGPNRPDGARPLELDGEWPGEIDAGPGPDQSAWWTRGSDRQGPTVLRCTGLPTLRTACGMVLGGLSLG